MVLIVLRLTDPSDARTHIVDKIISTPLNDPLMKRLVDSKGLWKRTHARGRQIPDAAITTLAIVGLFPSADMPITKPVLQSVPVTLDSEIRDPIVMALARCATVTDWVRFLNEHVEPNHEWGVMLQTMIDISWEGLSEARN